MPAHPTKAVQGMAKTMPDPIRQELLYPEQLRKISEEGELAELRRALDEARKAEAAQQGLRLALMTAAPHEVILEQVMTLARLAAAHGQCETLLFHFASHDCTDGGLRVRTSEPNWPETLQGAAKRAHTVYVEHLQSRGFEICPRIVSHVDAKFGDVGLFLCW